MATGTQAAAYLFLCSLVATNLEFRAMLERALAIDPDAQPRDRAGDADLAAQGALASRSHR